MSTRRIATAERRIAAEFVALIAFSMSLVAMSIDSMLPALGAVANDLGARAPNDRQLVLTTFFGGLTVGQLLYGPLSDALGRKRAMYAGLVILTAGSLCCLFATSFWMVLAGRLVAGVGAAGARIVSMAIVRDLYEGRAMAQVMSVAMSIFIIVPIIAPAIGQGILAVTTWRGIFGVLVVMTGTIFVWFATRQSETLPIERRRPLSAGPVMRAVAEVVRNRQTVTYTLAAGLVFAALIAYLATAQQIFGEQYGLKEKFPFYFAALAASLGAASMLNARLVQRFGMLALSSLALRASVVMSAAFLVFAFATGGQPPLWSFMAYMLAIFFCNGLLFGNFNALAMEPMGHIAGSAASVTGSITSFISLLIGTPIGRAYDGTVIPLVGGLFGMTLAALALTTFLAKPREGAVTEV
ncbi:MAG: multidrug effflux MFS transporter [Polyangiaceae bacterium]|nr:multidrug effflux MFS transporter [Polyangiaceae bacterium]